MGNLSLYVAREPPSTSLATVLAQKDRSFTCRSFASRTQSLFLFGREFVLNSLVITRGERSNQGAYYHIETSEA